MVRLNNVRAAALTVAAFCLWSAQARALCDPDYNYDPPTGYVECFPDANTQSTHDFTVVIGSDAWGQWAGYQDATNGDCTGWDWLGDVNGFYNHTRIGGMFGSDFIVTVASPGEEFCGFPLDPPVLNGHLLTLGNGPQSWYEGDGYDSYVSYITSQTNTIARQLPAVYVWTESFGIHELSDGSDLIIDGYGGTGGWISAFSGDDQVVINGATGPTVDCGGGRDMYNGAGANYYCEYSCPNWPFDCS